MDEFVSLVIGYFLGNILFAMIVTKIFLPQIAIIN